MLVEESFNPFIANCLDNVQVDIPKHIIKCPNCSTKVFMPIVAKDYDIQVMNELLDITHKVMSKYNIEGHILSELYTEIAIANAMKNSK
jgi:DNA-directed RNA polymerase subunit RPC12/RpoP